MKTKVGCYLTSDGQLILGLIVMVMRVRGTKIPFVGKRLARHSSGNAGYKECWSPCVFGAYLYICIACIVCAGMGEIKDQQRTFSSF